MSIVLLSAGLAASRGAVAAEASAPQFDNATCLACHGIKGFTVPAADGSARELHVSPKEFNESVHGVRQCVQCHQDVVQIPHRKGVDRKVGCVACHRGLWESAQRMGETEKFARLGEVVQQIDRYMESVHARPSIEDQSRTNATCYDCHDAHYIRPIDSTIGAWPRVKIPDICGKCHADERATYLTSVHGREVAENLNAFAAVCIDCHTTHDIESPKGDAAKLAITEGCGNCHEEQYRTYTGTYHGQVTTLGYAYTAKCFECHGSHAIQRVNDERSAVHPDNRLATCRNCHDDASKGFLTFLPHANPRDFDRYPYMWIASKFMILLVVAVFAFFWTHSLLWFYREHKDRAEGKNRAHIRMDEVPRSEGRYVRRFGPVWRIAHLLLVLSVMTLVLTGTTVLYADSSWAPAIMGLLGGPKAAGVVHRIAASVFIVLFFGHLIYFTFAIGQRWKTFRWFGPDSLIPNFQDLRDMAAMFRWFFGAGPRPVFDRWTYWEKFDYWAPFWGLAVIGVSGALLWSPGLTGTVLPGWIFNVATIIHGEEAFLAAVFLFTVHFFNSHFRPEKFPLDIVMFTGALPLEEFAREHTLEYRRLVESGELEKYIVNAPSSPMSYWSKVLGAVLLTVGLTLLALVLVGFVQGVLAP